MKLYLMVVSCLFLVFTINSYALNTTEVYDPGLSDIEFSLGVNEGEYTHTAVVGYGAGNWFNPSVFTEIVKTNGTSVFSFSVANFSNVYSGFVDADIIPSITYNAASQVFRTNIEISRIMGKLHPYLQIGLAQEFSGGSLNNSNAIGLALRVLNKGEFFTQFSVDKADFANTTGYGLGYNHMAGNGFEVISELTFDKNFIFSTVVGVILTI